MSDSTRTILWVVAALVVIALVVWYFVRSARRRRELEARRFDAQSLRASAEERTPEVRAQADRASVTEQIAADARAEAQEQARRAEQLEARAAEDQQRAEDAEREQEELRREADRIDPDVETEAETQVETETDEASNRVESSAGATTGSVGYREDDEPDLADHENPFADQPDQGTESTDDDYDAVGEVPQIAGADVARASARSSLPPSADLFAYAGAADGVMTSDDDEDDEADVAQVGGADGGPVGGADGGPVGGADGGAGGAAVARAELEQGRASAAGPELGSEPAAEPDDFEEGEGRGQGDPFMSDPAAVARREISRYDEVVDGGYGVGSAAPIHDGAQPLGHPVKAWHDSMTYAVEGAAGYGQGQPDVWFYDEGAARRAGFRPQG